MDDADRFPSESSEHTPESTTDLNIPQTDSSRSYQLTVKRGFLALLVMYAGKLLVGIGFAYGGQFIEGLSDGVDTVDTQMVGMTSVLIGGVVVLIWVWTDVRRLGLSFLPQIGLQPSVIKTSQAVMLVFLLVSATHVLAWIYRSVMLPLVGQGGVIGGGSQMFAHIQETGSALGMTAFLVLALVVAPVMEETIFRGYLQSALMRRMPSWVAISVTSLLFTVGHGPMILWPMYFMYSVAWGWIFMHTGSLRMAIAIHVMSNLFYTVVSTMGWKLLA